MRSILWKSHNIKLGGSEFRQLVRSHIVGASVRNSNKENFFKKAKGTHFPNRLQLPN